MRFPDPGRSRLIIIGSSTYEHETFNNIPAVDNCIQDLHLLLTAPGTGGFLAENCLIPAYDIDLQRLVTQIRQFSAGAKDVLVICFIGHGLFDIENRKLHLALRKTDPADLYYSALPFERLKRAFLASDAEVKILMMDCCFSGKVITEMAMGVPDLSDLVRDQIDVAGTYIMAACSGQEIAMALPGDRYTAFTGSIIEAFRGAVPLSMGDLFRQVSRELRGKALPAPHQASSGTAADVVLLRPESAMMRGITFTFNLPDEPDSVTGSFLTPPRNELSRATGEDKPAQLAQSEVGSSGAAFDPLSTVEREDRLQSLYEDAETIGLANVESNGQEFQVEPIIARLRQIITEMRQLSRPNHYLALSVRDLYAYWLSRAGMFREAVHQCTRVLQARKELYGSEHGVVLASRHNLAHMVGLAGEPAAAVSDLEAIVTDMSRVLGDRHPATLLSMKEMAYWTAIGGDVRRAVEKCKELYIDDDFWMGPLHQQTLLSLSFLAWAQGLAGNSVEARDSYSDLAARWSELNGSECPEALKYSELRDYWGRTVDGEL